MILAPTLTLSAGSGAAIVRPTFSRDFAGEKSLNNGTGPAITFTRASNATFFDASGVLQTASNDAPRFDHDPATAGNPSRGLLIEESRTNHCTNSQASGVIGATGPTGWIVDANGALGLTRTITTGVVNGMAYMDVRFNGTTTSGGNVRFDPRPSAGASASSGQAWTASAYLALQAGTIPAGAQMKVIARGRDSSDLATEDTQTNVTLTSSLTRYVATRTLSNANTARATHDTRLESVPSGAAVDFTLRIAAPQLEQGAFATSYIPTTTAAATRSADSAVVTPISSFYNQAEGTLFAEGSASADAGALVSADDTTASERIQIRRSVADNRLNLVCSDNNVSQTSIASSNGTWSTSSQIRRVAFAVKTDDLAASMDGASAITDTSATLPTVTRMVIGFGPNSNYANAHLRKIAYYPKRLSNTLLQQLTT